MSLPRALFDQNSATKLCPTAVRSSLFESLPGAFVRQRCGRAVFSIGNGRHSRGVFTPGVRKNTQPVLTHDLSNLWLIPAGAFHSRSDVWKFTDGPDARRVHDLAQFNKP
ncbi:uncharacterized protein METZ01_LOCUS345213, partial [marine metagenome]